MTERRSWDRCFRRVAIVAVAILGGGCGIEAMPAGARVGQGDPPCVLGLPDKVDLGVVPPGFQVPVPVEARNQRPDAACRVNSVRLESCDEAFSLGSTEPFTVGPGAAVEVPVNFRAEGNGQRACELVLGFGAGEPAKRIELAALVSSSCLHVTPEVRFPDTRESCVRTLPVRIYSSCGPELVLEGIELTSPAFVVVEPPALPAVIPQLEEVVLTVGFVPVSSRTETALLALKFAGATAPVNVSLRGSGSAPEPDRFLQAPKPKLDVLVVMENNDSMVNNWHVTGNLRKLPEYLAAQYVDFHLGVTTTGLEPGGNCPGGVRGAEDGRLFPVVGNGVRWIDSDTANPASAFAANLNVGACRTGASMPFEAAVRALTPPVIDHADDPRHPEPQDGNLGFLRPEAGLRLIFVSDHDDESSGSVAEYRTTLRSVKPSGDVGLYVFAGDPGEGCAGPAGRAEPGDRLHILATAGGPGSFASLCQRDWELDLREMSMVDHSIQTCFFLTREPVDRDGDGAVGEGDFLVRVNGETVPPIGSRGQDLWTYQADLPNAICFHPLAVPAPGSEITVDYRSPCE